MIGKDNTATIDGNNNLVIQDVRGSKIFIVNLNDSDEVKTFLINFQDQLNRLPIDILEQLKQHQKLEKEITKGANIYVTILGMYSENIYSQRYQKIGLQLSITLTNLTKEIRYFNRPYFKTNPRLPGQTDQYDSFIMLEKKEYPIRLEYGEVASTSYDLKDGFIEEISKINVEGAYLEAFISTTVGELYSSNKMDIELLFRS